MAIQIAEGKGNRASKLAAAKDTLVNAVRELQTSEGWTRMLKSLSSVSRFGLRRLSFRNQILTLAQRPYASRVATFKAWQVAGRQVQKGEKSITILAPIIIKKRMDGEQESEESETKLVGFRPHPVFDISQTQVIPGRKVEAEPDIKEFIRDVEDSHTFTHTVEQLRQFALLNLKDSVSGIEIRPRRPGDHREAHGWYSPDSRTIVTISGETSRSMQIKTLLHELGHAVAGVGSDREEDELIAESTAFLCCHALGIDAIGYSAPYCGAWGGKDAAKVILRVGSKVVSTANRILDALMPTHVEPELQEAA